MTARPNAELAWRVIDHIDAHPEQWNQGIWIGKAECGTVACFAGWTVLLSGYQVDQVDELVVDGPPLGQVDLRGLEVPDAAELLLRIGALVERVERIFGPRPRSCCDSTEDVGHDFTCPAMLGAAGIEIVDHGPVKPPYGSPEREAYDRENGGQR